MRASPLSFMWLFYLFAALLILQSLISLRGGWRWLAYFRRESARAPSSYTPFVSVVVPCRGLDQGLTENLRALFVQDYPRYEIIFVLDSPVDPAHAVIEELRAAYEAQRRRGQLATRLVIAGQARDCGQKVHNLSVALRACAPASEVFVFVDTDARARRDWLRALVAPLADSRIGAATGYRWFVPAGGGLSSHLRSVWNASIASALGANSAQNFCWGGSTAIRRETFATADVLAHWRGAVSDDFALTRALKAAQWPIHFVPACLIASHEDCTFRELLEFTTRQLKITRVYAAHLWRIVLVSNLLFVVIFFGGLALTVGRAWHGASFAPTLALLVCIFLLGALKASLRLRAVAHVLACDGVRPTGPMLIAHLCLWPFTAALYAYNALAAAASRRIVWRGIAYELRSPGDTVVRHESGQPQLAGARLTDR